MEDIVYVFIGIIVMIGGLAIAYIAKMPLNRGKKVSKVVEESALQVIGDQVKEMGGTFKEMMEFKNKQIKSLQGQMSKYHQDEEDDQPENQNNEVKFDDIKALVKKAYPQHAKFLDLPFAKKEIMKVTKGMTLEEVVTMVEDWTGKKIADRVGSESGSGQSQDQTGYF